MSVSDHPLIMCVFVIVGTATATEEETGPQLSRKPSLQYSDVSSDRGKNRPFQFGGSQEHHHRRRTSSELSAASRGSHGSRHSMQQETSRGGGGGGGADDATLPESRTPGPQEGSVSGSGLPPRPPDKVKKFEVHYSDGTTATVFASEVCVVDSILLACELHRRALHVRWLVFCSCFFELRHTGMTTVDAVPGSAVQNSFRTPMSTFCEWNCWMNRPWLPPTMHRMKQSPSAVQHTE